MALFKSSYSYMKIISLLNVMEKIINDSFTLFLFSILKLLCPIFCTFIIFSLINVCVSLCEESHLRSTVYEFTLNKLRLDLTFFYFSSQLCFKLLYYIC